MALTMSRPGLITPWIWSNNGGFGFVGGWTVVDAMVRLWTYYERSKPVGEMLSKKRGHGKIIYPLRLARGQ